MVEAYLAEGVVGRAALKGLLEVAAVLVGLGIYLKRRASESLEDYIIGGSALIESSGVGGFAAAPPRMYGLELQYMF